MKTLFMTLGLAAMLLAGGYKATHVAAGSTQSTIGDDPAPRCGPPFGDPCSDPNEGGTPPSRSSRR